MFLAAELNGKRLHYRQNEYSLTFDDGPTAGVTVELARLLQHEEISATFFVLGEHSDDATLSELVKCGQRIGNHTFSHQNLDRYTGDHEVEIPHQIGRCHERIERFSRKRIPFRAPGGAWSNPRFTKIANRLAYAGRYIGRYGWDIDAADWRLHRRKGDADKSAFDDFCRRFEDSLNRHSRGIILLHDGVPGNEAELADPAENQAVRVAEFAIATLRKRAARIVPLKEPWSLFG